MAPADPSTLGRPANVMLSVAAELARIRNDMRALEDVIGHILAFAAPDEVSCRIQAVDLVVQEIDDLARFCAAVSGSMGQAAPFDLAPALSVLKLRRLSETITGGRMREPISGEVDLF